MAGSQQKLEYNVRAHLLSLTSLPYYSDMVDPCIRAINRANHGEFEKRIRMPKGMSYRGERFISVKELIEVCDLDRFTP